MNKVTVKFEGCSPAPSGGYNIMYRVEGSSDLYRNAGNFFISPAVFYDTLNPAGTCYEGFIRTDCGGVMGDTINWNSCESSSGGEINGNIDNVTGTAVITSMQYGGISLNYIDGDTLPMSMGSGNYSLPYLTSGDSFSINVSGTFTQIKITDNAGDHILPYAGAGIYFQTLTLNPLFPIFSVEVS